MSIVNLDLNLPKRVFPHRFNTVIGSGHLGLVLHERLIQHLRMAREELGVEYLRCHGILSEALGVYSEYAIDETIDEDLGFAAAHEDGESSVARVGRRMNFTLLDQAFDRLLEIGIKPFVEFGFMPQDLASGDRTVFYWKGNVTPPKDYKIWRELITAMIEHWERRYGREEMESWYYEVWNEPNLSTFWSADMAEYYKLYATTAHAVKAVNSNYRVGGPATAGRVNSFIPEFLEYCEKESVPVDFVSSHAYPVAEGIKQGDFAYNKLRPADFLANRFAEMKAEIEASAFPGLPLHITEYNSTTSSRHLLHDLPTNAAYLARTLSDAGDAAESFSYWTVSDIFLEEGIPPAPFHGGYGLITTQGIRKPTFHLFKSFARLGDELLSKGEDHIATRSDGGRIAGILWNARMSQSAVRRIDIVAAKADYTLLSWAVDEERGNPYKTWKDLGYPRYPSKEQLAFIDQSSSPLQRSRRVQADNGRLSVDIEVGKNGFTAFELIPLVDEAGSYRGLDESLLDAL